MLAERRFQIAAVAEQVPFACEFVVDAARDAGLDERAVHHCRLAVDEACTNIAEHGFDSHGQEHVIELVCVESDDRFMITISDDAPYFDPTAMPSPNTDLSLEEREPGGYGIFFIKKVMDSVHYERAYEHNILTISKAIPERVLSEPPEPQIVTAPIHVSMLHPKIALIAPNGKIDATTYKSVEAVLLQQVSEGRKALILLLTNVDYMSSAGMKMLVGIWQRARDVKCELILCGVQPRVREILQIVGLDLVFTIAETLDQAMNSVKFKK